MQCKNLKKFCPDPRKFDLLKRKGVYPYDYVDSVDKLLETALPLKEAFYSKLNDEYTQILEAQNIHLSCAVGSVIRF